MFLIVALLTRLGSFLILYGIILFAFALSKTLLKAAGNTNTSEIVQIRKIDFFTDRKVEYNADLVYDLCIEFFNMYVL